METSGGGNLKWGLGWFLSEDLFLSDRLKVVIMGLGGMQATLGGFLLGSGCRVGNDPTVKGSLVCSQT